MNKENDMLEKLEFLREYRKLCIEHGMQITGCGCCGSAWVQGIGIKEDVLSCDRDCERVWMSTQEELDETDEDRITIK